MNFLKKIILILLFLFPISNSFGAMGTHVQTWTFNDGNTGTGDGIIAGIEFNKDGTKMYIVVHNGKVYQFSLGAPYDFSNITYDTGSGEDFGDGGDIEFNNDGTKLFYLDGQKNDATLTEFSLSTPYDITTKTQIASQTLSINVSAKDPANGFQFNSNGTAMFILLILEMDII